jgi:hypothetical protein
MLTTKNTMDTPTNTTSSTRHLVRGTTAAAPLARRCVPEFQRRDWRLRMGQEVPQKTLRSRVVDRVARA